MSAATSFRADTIRPTESAEQHAARIEADACLERYRYWTTRASEHARGPLGCDSECYRAALAMGYRALGQFDILNRAAGR